MKCSRLALMGLIVAAAGGTVRAAVANAAVNPAGWNVGDAGSTYQHWIANSAADNLAGTPNQGYNTAGATLTAPVLSVNSPGYSSGTSGIFYSFGGNYSFTAAIANNNTVTLPAHAGTQVIVQVFSILPSSESITGILLTDSANNALSNVALIQSTHYGDASGYPTPFGPADVRVDLYEFWVPNFTGDFNVLTSVLDHTGIMEVRVDTMIASANEDGSSPFAPVAVPEPASLAALSVGAGALLLRRSSRSR